MKMIAIALTMSFLAFTGSGSTIEVLQPQAGTTLTNGARFTIKWTPLPDVTTVRISLCPDEYHGGFITQSAPNTGEYSWTVDRVNYDPKYYKSFFISVQGSDPRFHVWTADSGYFTIVDGIVAPPKPELVPVRIRKVVSVEWTANTNHYYHVQASTNLLDWDVVAEGQPADTNAIALFYAEDAHQYFKVLDTTP